MTKRGDGEERGEEIRRKETEDDEKGKKCRGEEGDLGGGEES